MKDEGGKEGSNIDPSALGSSFILHPSSFPPWLPALLQTSDSLFPTGAYAHSGGLETLVELGVVRDASTLSGFLRGRLVPALARFELPYLRFAWKAATTGDLDTLRELDCEYGAAKLPLETRQASAHVGRQRLRTLLRVRPPGEAANHLATEFQASIERGESDGHAAVVGGVQAALLRVPADAACAAHFYGSVSGYCSAALKLIRIGQEGCQTALAETLTLAEASVHASADVPREEAGWCDPGWEIAAARHERAFARLFIS